MSKVIPTLPLTAELRDFRMICLEHYKIQEPNFRMVLVTCGLPRSGKSTWARSMNLPMVDPDAVRLAFQGRPYLVETEEWIWCIARVMLKSLFYAGHRDVIVQGCNMSSKHREQWTPPQADWYPVFCLFETSPEVCLKRAEANLRPDLISVIKQMAARNKAPEKYEGAAVIIRP